MWNLRWQASSRPFTNAWNLPPSCHTELEGPQEFKGSNNPLSNNTRLQGLDSLSILFNHRSFLQNRIRLLFLLLFFFWVSGGFLEGSLERMDMEGTPRLRSWSWPRVGDHTPQAKYPFFSGYDVDSLLKKEVFTMETQVFQKNTLKKSG